MYYLLLSAWLVLAITICAGQPYDVYDTNYEYEVGDTQAREEVLIVETPEIVSQPLDLVVSGGWTVRLPCMVDRLEGYVLLWRKDSKIVSVGSQVVGRRDKISVEEGDNGNTLVVHDVGGDDSGEYVCSVSTYVRTEIRHSLLIRVGPVITTEDQVVAREGEHARLACQLQEGSPIPSLRWRRCEGGPYLKGEEELLESVLLFSSVSRDDSGCYVCIADQYEGVKSVTSKTMLVVQYPPTVSVTASEDYSMLTCEVDAVPAPHITWLREGVRVRNTEAKITTYDNKYTDTLPLDSRDTAGRYTCRADNSLASREYSLDMEAIRKEKKETMGKTDFKKVYFARVPSLYTAPVKPFTNRKKLVLDKQPKNAEEFLQLLRIYYQQSFLPDKQDHNNNPADNHQEIEQTTDQDLLRSTHSYLSHLEETMGWKNNPDLQEIDLPSEVEQKQNKVFINSHINESIKSENKIDEGNEIHQLKLLDDKEYSATNETFQDDDKSGSRYLNNIKKIKDKMTKSNETNIPGMRNQYIEQTNLKSLDSNDYIHSSRVVHNTKTNLVKEHSKKEDRQKERYLETIRDQSQHEELLTGSTRYLKEAQLTEKTKAMQEDTKETESKVLRGHHSPLSSLTEKTSEKTVFGTSEESNQKEKEETSDVEEVNQSEENRRETPERKTTNIHTGLNKNKILDDTSIGPRFLNEVQLIQDVNERLEDTQERKSKVLRGHHSILSNLYETNTEMLEKGDSNFEEERGRSNQNYPNEIKEDNIIKGEDHFYPQQIRDIENQYFKKLAQSKIPMIKNPLPMSAPVQTPEPEVKTTVSRHPLKTPAINSYKEIDHSMRGQHQYEKTLPNISGKHLINKEKEKTSLQVSNPLRGVYSSAKIIKNVEDEQDKRRNKERGRKSPHPFAGLRFKIP